MMRFGFLALLLFLLTQETQSQVVTMRIGQDGSDMFVEWSGSFTAYPFGLSVADKTRPNELDFMGLRTGQGASSHFVYTAATNPRLDEYIFNPAVNQITVNPPILPSFSDTTPDFVSNVSPNSFMGYKILSASSGAIFVPGNYVMGNEIEGCVMLYGITAESSGFTEGTWDILQWASNNKFRLQVNFATPLPVLCGGSGGSGGDPHFHTWSGERFDFHGHCDLVLLQNDVFQHDHTALRHDNDDDENNKGLSVHIRSSQFKTYFSYISAVAIKIGKDIAEFDGKGNIHFASSGQADEGPLKTIGGCPLETKQEGKDLWIHTIDLGKGTLLLIRVQHGWCRVVFKNADPNRFRSSRGLMGSFNGGTWLARDGKTVLSDVNEFGMEWQVQESDGLLFQTPSHYPDKCELLSEADVPERGRRLLESSITHEQAAKACAKWGEGGMKDCILDVMLLEDLEAAEWGPY